MQLHQATVASASHSMGNLLNVSHHSASQVYPEQYVDSWDRQQQQQQAGASIARVNAVLQSRANAHLPYRDYLTTSAYNPYNANYPTLARPTSLVPLNRRINGADIYAINHYEAGPSQRLGFWTPTEPPRQIIPIIREPGIQVRDGSGRHYGFRS